VDTSALESAAHGWDAGDTSRKLQPNSPWTRVAVVDRSPQTKQAAARPTTRRRVRSTVATRRSRIQTRPISRAFEPATRVHRPVCRQPGMQATVLASRRPGGTSGGGPDWLGNARRNNQTTRESRRRVVYITRQFACLCMYPCNCRGDDGCVGSLTKGKDKQAGRLTHLIPARRFASTSPGGRGPGWFGTTGRKLLPA